MSIELNESDIGKSVAMIDKNQSPDLSNIKQINLMVDATNDCQLHCKYCYFGEKGCSMMNTEKLFRAIKKIIAAVGPQLKTISINYMGGEPMLGWKMIIQLNEKMQSFCEAEKITFKWSLTSNLVALNEKKKEHMIREGAGIHCSVDGPKNIHDANRPFRNGKGSFEIVDKNISLALQISPNDTARVTISPESSHHLPKIAEYLFDKGFIRIGLYPAYNLDWKEADLKSWTEGLKIACEIALKKNKQIATVISPRRREKQQFEFCGAGKGLWALDVNGVLYNCHRLTNKPEYAIIDASKASIKMIREAMINKTLAPRTIEAPEKCQECSALKFCSGGCWAENLTSNNTPYLPESIACKFRQITHESIKEYLDMPLTRINDWQCMLFVICCQIACDVCDSAQTTCDGCEGVGCQSCMFVCDPSD